MAGRLHQGHRMAPAFNRRRHADRRDRRPHGCTLIEVVVATACLFIALASLAPVYAASAHAARRATLMTRATILAQDKIEELVARVASEAGLAESPPGALTSNVDGCFDVAGGFLRRWSISPLPAAPGGASFITVVVRHQSAVGEASWDARLITVRRRTS